MQVARTTVTPSAALAPSVGRTPGKMPLPEAGTLRVGAFNTMNFFDSTEDPADPSKPGAKIPTAAEYQIKLTKLAMAIRDKIGAPDILSMEEVENQHVLDDLLAQPALKSLGYKSIIGEGNDNRGIHVAMIYRSGRVEPTHIDQTNPVDTTLLNPWDQIDTSKLFARAPLTVDFKLTGISQATDGAAITVIANHFKSKLGGPKQEPRRVAQGVYLSGVVDAMTAAKPTVPVIVLGDFNATYDDGAFKAMATKADGSQRLYDTPLGLPDTDRYSFNYRGRKDMLDHLMVTPEAKGAITSVTIPHFNTYDGVKNKAADPKVADGVSDHDPVLINFDTRKLFTK